MDVSMTPLVAAACLLVIATSPPWSVKILRQHEGRLAHSLSFSSYGSSVAPMLSAFPRATTMLSDNWENKRLLYALSAEWMQALSLALSSPPAPGLEEASVMALGAQALTVAQAPPWLAHELPLTVDQVGVVPYCGVPSPLPLMISSPPAETTSVDQSVSLGAAWYVAPAFWHMRQQKDMQRQGVCSLFDRIRDSVVLPGS